MYITVKLLNNFSKLFTYKVPQSLVDVVRKGSLIQVPLQKRTQPAIVHELLGTHCTFAFAVKEIDGLYELPKDATYHQFVTQLAWLYQISSVDLFSRVKNFLDEHEQDDFFLTAPQEQGQSNTIVLTDEQQIAYEAIAHMVAQKKHASLLLHGVTGSGKTEVYKKILHDVVSAGQSALLMLPEVTLALQFEQLLKSCTNLPLFGFHSSTTPKQKKILWQHLLQGAPVVIIGVHLPALLPIANLGLIIIDEEHEVGYQEKKHPQINSKRAALLKAWHAKVPVLLGSATPSLESLYNVAQKKWQIAQLKMRYAGSFPTVQVVSLADKKERKNFWISSELYMAMKKQLEKKEQTIIFMNRRGYSFFVQCKECSDIAECTNCSVSLTLHDDGRLVCHYCGYMQKFHEVCSKCQSTQFLKKGIGTQQVVTILQKLFPSARIARADADTTSKKKEWQQTVQGMHDRTIDILVGTQSITKGYDFSGVTLVGVLWADINLHFPMYNAAETTLQQIIQVAGRAGRHIALSKVIVQTMADHPIYQFISELDYQKFYEYEIGKRQETMYPPVAHIAEIEMRNSKQLLVEREAEQLADFLLEQDFADVFVLGPVPAIVYRVQQTYCQKIYIKSSSRMRIIQLFETIPTQELQSFMSFTLDPV